MADGETALLDYASPPGNREPWGPLLLRPSARSLVLVVLTALAALWLALRHEPWRRVGAVPTSRSDRPFFTRDNQLLTIDGGAGVSLYDPATARRIRTVLSPADVNLQAYRYFALAGGQQVLALPYVDRVALLYDVASGRVIERLPNPDGVGSLLVAVAPDGPRLLTRPTDGFLRPGSTGYLAWDLHRLGGRSEPASLGKYRDYDSLVFSPDGTRVLGTESSISAGFGLFDGRSFALVRREVLASNVSWVRGGFGAGEAFWMARGAPVMSLSEHEARAPAVAIEIRSTRTGEPLRKLALDSGTDLVGRAGALKVSPDLRRAAVRGASALHLFDLSDGHPIEKRPAPYDDPVQFFPNSDHLVVTGDARNQLAIIAAGRRQPLAVLEQKPPLVPYTPYGAEIGPDGRTIVAPSVMGGSLHVFRPAGWDCAESQYGAFAFPQTWLTATFLAALTLSLIVDARRARPPSAARPVSPLLINGIVLIALPLTTHALLAACLGRWVRTPAPLLLLLAIGLVTHARAWRAIAVVLLAAVLPLLAWNAQHLRLAGLSSTASYPLLDRYYDIPLRLPLAATGVLVLLVLAGIYLLVRPRAEIE